MWCLPCQQQLALSYAFQSWTEGYPRCLLLRVRLYCSFCERRTYTKRIRYNTAASKVMATRHYRTLLGCGFTLQSSSYPLHPWSVSFFALLMFNRYENYAASFAPNGRWMQASGLIWRTISNLTKSTSVIKIVGLECLEWAALYFMRSPY